MIAVRLYSPVFTRYSTREKVFAMPIASNPAFSGLSVATTAKSSNHTIVVAQLMLDAAETPPRALEGEYGM